MWQWEALDKSNRKLVAEEERRAFLQSEVARWRRAKASGTLAADADEEMLLLVSCALRVFPLILPQVVSLVTGMDPLDPEFRQRWTACLECIGGRLFGPESKSGDALVGEADGPVKIRKQSPPRTAAGGGRH
jgi:hypothetical protein